MRIEESEWEELYFHYREMSKATGAQKPSESQKAKALWAMKAAKDREEEFYDPARKDNILGRKQTKLELCKEHLEDPIMALDKALKCLENPCHGCPLAQSSCVKSPELHWPAVGWSQAFCQRCGKKRSGRPLIGDKEWDNIDIYCNVKPICGNPKDSEEFSEQIKSQVAAGDMLAASVLDDYYTNVAEDDPCGENQITKISTELHIVLLNLTKAKQTQW